MSAPIRSLSTERFESSLLEVLRGDNPDRLRNIAEALPIFASQMVINGEDLLTLAIRLNARHCIVTLHQLGISMNRLSLKEEKHPLEEAMDHKAPLVLEHLLECGADPNGPHTVYGTIMRAAAVTRTIDSLIPLLCARGGNPSAPSPDGSTPLHAAVVHGQTLNVEQFLDVGANINATDFAGRTPLQLAITRLDVFEPIVSMLLDYGANPLVPDYGGLTAIDLARVRGEFLLVRHLEERIAWDDLLSTPVPLQAMPAGVFRPVGETFRKELLLAVRRGNRRQLREVLEVGGQPWTSVQVAEESPLLLALAKKRLDLAAPLIAGRLGIGDRDAQAHNAIYWLVLATTDMVLLKPFLKALHAINAHLHTAVDKDGQSQVFAAMSRSGVHNSRHVEALVEFIRRL